MKIDKQKIQKELEDFQPFKDIPEYFRNASHKEIIILIIGIVINVIFYGTLVFFLLEIQLFWTKKLFGL